uniref:Uncharacterized protein n=1 Tax=Candidatus Kentrum sp. FW TaxID=2126338 RepID=A0A450T428_9GAMM|nr:MAG: hypothetical protein BECKFW1821C_GA0114237_100142 [Candidatus Kentron sp. FW]
MLLAWAGPYIFHPKVTLKDKFSMYCRNMNSSYDRWSTKEEISSKTKAAMFVIPVTEVRDFIWSDI